MTDHPQTRSIQRIAVYAGSRDGNDPRFLRIATETGRLLAENGYEIVYGGGDSGLMAAVVKAALAAGGRVKGYIVEAWLATGASQAPPGVEEVVVNNREVRKNIVRMNSEASLMLFGGFGSFDEIFDIAAWKDEQRYLNPGAPPRPVLVLNHDNLNAALKALVDDAIAKGFIYSQSLKTIGFVGTTREAIALLNDCNRAVVKTAPFPGPPSP